jgi:hypothetical protein
MRLRTLNLPQGRDRVHPSPGRHATCWLISRASSNSTPTTEDTPGSSMVTP